MLNILDAKSNNKIQIERFLTTINFVFLLVFQYEDQLRDWISKHWNEFIQTEKKMSKHKGDQLILQCGGEGVVPKDKSVLKQELTWDLISWTPTAEERKKYLEEKTCLWDGKHTYDGYNISMHAERNTDHESASYKAINRPAPSALERDTQWVDSRKISFF